MIKNSEKYRNYVPYPFWAMDQEFFFKYANDLTGDGRNQLTYFPFKWAYVPPHDSTSVLEFLHDIGVDDDKVTCEEALAVYQQALPDYEVIPIEATIQTNAGGAINCSSKEIPDIKWMREAFD